MEKDIKPRDILTPQAFENAFALDMAMGGSTNTVLHTLAVANEAGGRFELTRSTRWPSECPISARFARRKVPYRRCGSSRRDQCDSQDDQQETGHAASGLHDRHRQDAGREYRRVAEVTDDDVIRPLDNAYSDRGGSGDPVRKPRPRRMCVKTGGVAPSMMKFTGPAVIFESEEEASAGILNGEVKRATWW